MTGFIEFSTGVWVLGNLVALGIFFSAAVFAVLYPILYNIRVTTVGPHIWRAILSVAGFGFLVVIGLFVDSRVDWWQMPEDVAWWRPLLRLVIYGLIAYSFTSLSVVLIVRRFWPHRLKTRPLTTALDIPPRTFGSRS